MKTILFFDTETNGLVNHKLPSNHPSQPRIVQLAAVLMEGGKEIMSLSVMIKPDGWSIPAEVEKIHGFTTEYAAGVGISIGAALVAFSEMADRAQVICAHNAGFDKIATESEALKIGLKLPEIYAKKEWFDTMKSSTNICKIPGPYGFKWPKLSEAYQFFFKETLEGAHDALVDVRACARIYKHLNAEAVANG